MPPERKLAEQLGVSRGTLRAALGRLETRGLVRVVQGSGYTVYDYREEGGLDLVPGLFEAFDDPGRRWAIARDLLAIRRRLAAEVLDRLASVDGSIDTREVEMAIEAFDAAIPRGHTQELARLDRQVLKSVVAITGSSVLQLCLNPIGQVLSRCDGLRDAIYRDAEASTAAYGLLVGWLRASPRAEPGAILAALEARDEATLGCLAERWSA